MKRALLACAVLLALSSAVAHATGQIRGTIWSSRGEARRSELAREKNKVVKPPRLAGLFDFLGTPALRKTPAAPARTSSGMTSAG